MPFARQPLAPGLGFGAIVTGLDPRDLNDETVRESLIELWRDCGVIVFRAATAASAPPQAAAAEPSTHPLTGLFATTLTALPAPPGASPIEPRRTTCRQNE